MSEGARSLACRFRFVWGQTDLVWTTLETSGFCCPLAGLVGVWLGQVLAGWRLVWSGSVRMAAGWQGCVRSGRAGCQVVVRSGQVGGLVGVCLAGLVGLSVSSGWFWSNSS